MLATKWLRKCRKGCAKKCWNPSLRSSVFPIARHNHLYWHIVAQVANFRWGHLEMGCGPGVRLQSGFAAGVVEKFLSSSGLHFQWFDSAYCPEHGIQSLLWVSPGSYSRVALDACSAGWQTWHQYDICFSVKPLVICTRLQRDITPGGRYPENASVCLAWIIDSSFWLILIDWGLIYIAEVDHR